MSADCIFCKIAAGEVDSQRVYEDDRFIAFLDIHPVRPGHALVIPKAHHPTLAETPDEELAELAVVAKKVAVAVSSATHADGFNFSVNNGAAAGQVIFHTHIHIIPRKTDDRLQPWPHRDYEKGEIESVAMAVREKIFQIRKK